MQTLGASVFKLRLASWSRCLQGDRSKFGEASIQRVRPSKVSSMCCSSRANSTVPALSQATDEGSRKVYVDHTFYKGKCAMRLRPLKPTFRVIENGGAALEREGTVFLEFANASGVRQYEWTKKGIFAVSVGEIGTLIGLKPGDSHEFFHDPAMGKSGQGNIRKSLKIEPIPDKDGFFFNLTVANKGESSEERYTMAVSRSEYTVMRALFTYALPMLKGWHTVEDPSLVEDLLESPTP